MTTVVTKAVTEPWPAADGRKVTKIKWVARRTWSGAEERVGLRAPGRVPTCQYVLGWMRNSFHFRDYRGYSKGLLYYYKLKHEDRWEEAVKRRCCRYKFTHAGEQSTSNRCP